MNSKIFIENLATDVFKKEQKFIIKEVEFEKINPNDIGKVYDSPYYTEFNVSKKAIKNTSSMLNCKRISRDEYIDVSTGEIKKYSTNECKTEDSYKESHRIVPKVIKGFFKGESNERHLILKYDNPLYDPKSLSNDMKDFLKKIKRLCPNFIYLYGKEPFDDGSWHIHCIIKLIDEIEFNISANVLTKKWKNGDVIVEEIRNIDRFAWRFDILRTDRKRDRLKYYPSGLQPFVFCSKIKKEIEVDTIKYEELSKYIVDKELEYRKQNVFGYENNRGGINVVAIQKYEQYKK